MQCTLTFFAVYLTFLMLIDESKQIYTSLSHSNQRCIAVNYVAFANFQYIFLLSKPQL